MMKLFLSVILGLLAAMFAAVLVAALTSGPKGIPALSLGPSDAQVVTASKALSAGHVLTEEDLKLESTLKTEMGTGAITAIRPAVGRVLIRPAIEGQQIRSNMIAGLGTGPEIEAMLEEGSRASTITIADRGLAAFVYPGATVDVIAIFDVPRGYVDAGKTISRTVLQAVTVLAVEGYSNAMAQFQASQAEGGVSSGSRKGPTITLLLKPSEAEILQLAKSLGTVSVTLRPNEEQPTGPSDASTLEELLQLTAARKRTTPSPNNVPNVVTAKAPVVPVASGGASTGASEPESDDEDWQTVVIRGGKRTTYTFEENDDNED
ncbi:MAG: Flp pilus assembly protein CpaB [Planctomycetes bacterium TMED75]|nr:Flp pilus assembly protein CpaB [Planctomycetaceae bacterium]OUU94908.1 MAG: Flp pilus assembly protein CpaB [Planctomycetes bacterium TMED75]